MLPCTLRFHTDLKTRHPYPRLQGCTVSHSYLLRDLSCIMNYNPRLVGKIIDKAMSSHTHNRNVKPPPLKLASYQPLTIAPKYDTSRGKLAYGSWALPILKKELGRDDAIPLMQTLNNIHDLVHDPEKCIEAIRLGVVDRLTDMMFHEKDFIREKICMIFCTVAGTDAGRRAIIKRYKILHNLALLAEDEEPIVKHKAHSVLEMIALSPTTAIALNFADFLLLVLRLVGGSPKTKETETIIIHLDTLKKLLDGDIKKLALNNNAMEIFMEKLDHEDEKVKCGALDCIALLCQIDEGRKEAAEKGLGNILCEKLFEPSMKVKIKVVGALAFLTILSKIRGEFCKKCTVRIFVEILEYFHCPEGQLMAAKALSNLMEHPMGRYLVKLEKRRIKSVYTADNKDVERHKSLLLQTLN